MKAAVTNDLKVTSTWVTHGSRNLSTDALAVECHWASHVCLHLTLQAAQRSFLDRAIQLSVSPGRSRHTLTRCSLYAKNWTMATPITMRSDRKDTYVPGCPFFRLTLPQRALAPHTFKCWWEFTENIEDLHGLRTRMLAQLPSTGTHYSDMDTDHEQVSSNDEIRHFL